MDLSFYFSPGSRYSYLALTQMAELERSFDVSFDWIPVMGSRIRELRGVDPFAGPPQSGQYDWSYRERDATMWAQYYGVPFSEPRDHMLDAEMLGRAAIAAASLGNVRGYPVALATRVYGTGAWPVDAALAEETAASEGLEVPAFREVFESSSQALEANCESAVARGVFGTPTFFVGNTLIWGNDRLPLLRHALRTR